MTCLGSTLSIGKQSDILTFLVEERFLEVDINQMFQLGRGFFRGDYVITD